MCNRYRNWCFTLYSDPSDVDFDDVRTLRYCVYQHELCPKTGQDHWQGYMEFGTPKRMKAVKEILQDRSAHLEARRGTREQARAYCMKLDTRFPGEEPYEFGDFGTKQGQREDLNLARLLIQESPSWSSILQNEELTVTVARHKNWAREIYENRPREVEYPVIKLYHWQTEAMEYLEGKPEKRRILWCWSRESGTGKSTFFDYCSCRWNVLPGTDYPNTLYAYDDQPIIWFDLSRHQTSDHVPYHALEKLSNGGFHLSTKYVPCRKLVSAHIVVCANIPPDETILPDRCVILYANKMASPIEPMDDSQESQAVLLQPQSPDITVSEEY